jgi:CRP-like cAMP-binding protein
MKLLEAHFSIQKVRECPMYEEQDLFSLAGLSLLPPYGKPACLFLAKGLADILLQYLDRKEEGCEKLKDSYSCPGCTGIIKFGPVADSGGDYLTPEMRLLTSAAKRDNALESEALVDMLGTFSFFQALEGDHLREIVQHLQQVVFEPGAKILKKGDAGSYLYIIISGSVSVVDEDGDVITTLNRGEIFGEMSLISGKPVSANIQAAEPSRVLLLSGKDLSDVLVKYPFLQMAFTRMLVQRLSQSNIQRSEEFAAGVTGRFEDINPSELFQMFNENRKTGMFDLKLSKGKAQITFSDGAIVRAEYIGLTEKEAFWAILRETEGSFKFTSSLSLEDMAAKPIGNFLGLLMEGMRLLDEENAKASQQAEK